MKSMKLFVGLAAVVALSTGCGGSYAEDACDRLKTANDDAAERMDACIAAGEDTSFDTEVCLESLEQCSEENAKQTSDFLACVVDATTCSSFDSDDEPTESYIDQILDCEDEHNPSSSCLEELNMLSGQRATQAVRKALQVRQVL